MFLKDVEAEVEEGLGRVNKKECGCCQRPWRKFPPSLHLFRAALTECWGNVAGVSGVAPPPPPLFLPSPPPSLSLLSYSALSKWRGPVENTKGTESLGMQPRKQVVDGDGAGAGGSAALVGEELRR